MDIPRNLTQPLNLNLQFLLLDTMSPVETQAMPLRTQLDCEVDGEQNVRFSVSLPKNLKNNPIINIQIYIYAGDDRVSNLFRNRNEDVVARAVRVF